MSSNLPNSIKSFLSDVHHQRWLNKCEMASQPDLSHSTYDKNPNSSAPKTPSSINETQSCLKDLYHISSDLLTFKQNAENMTGLLFDFAKEINVFPCSKHDANKYIRSLRINLVSEFDYIRNNLKYELEGLEKKHCQVAEDEDDDLNMLEDAAEFNLTEDMTDMEEEEEEEEKEHYPQIERLQDMLAVLDDCPTRKAQPISNRLSLVKKGTNVATIANPDRFVLSSGGSGQSSVYMTWDEGFNDCKREKNCRDVVEDLLDEVSDRSSSSCEDIRLELSSASTFQVIPKSKVLRMCYRDSQENKHTLNKFYVATDECYVKIPLREKLLVDNFRKTSPRKNKRSHSSSRSSSDSNTRSGSSSSVKLSPVRRKSRRIMSSDSRSQSSENSDTSSEDSYTSLSYFGSDSRSDVTSVSSYDNDRSSDSTFKGEDDEGPLDGVPDENSSSSSASSSRDSEEVDEPNRTKGSAKGKKYSGQKPRPEWMQDPLLKRIRPLESSSDEEDVKGEEEDDIKPCNLSGRKHLISSSDDESDVEFISSGKNVPDDGSPKKGRRNIRDILSKGSLNEATQAVQEEERERVNRLQLKKSQEHSQDSVSDNQDDFVLDAHGDIRIIVNRKLTQKLLPHQRQGVKFMWDNCYESIDRVLRGDKGGGCILAHCMGLGKTYQVVTLVLTLCRYACTRTKTVLVICPLSLVENWNREFIDARKMSQQWDFNVHTLKGSADDRSQRMYTVKRWAREGGVLLTGYHSYVAFLNSDKQEIFKWIADPGPDLVVCDEGHLLKAEATRRTKAVSQIRTSRRIILTGTPMQNNLDEYYCMVGFIKPHFLGTMKEYRNRFSNPIKNGQYEDSTPMDIQRMKKRSHVLHKMTAPFIQRFEERELLQHLPLKYDYALKIRMCEVQVRLVKKFFDIFDRKEIFANLAVLRAICTHPYLLQMKCADGGKRNKRAKKSKATLNDEELLAECLPSIDPAWWRDSLPANSKHAINHGPKLVVMMSIINETLARGDKLLIFSVSLSELDIVEHFLHATDAKWARNRTYTRLDGSVDVQTRAQYCKQFNLPDSPVKLMLLTHKVGGLGLNLHSANRVIILDTSWNPADDTQSVFRVYRIGQKKPCFVYRLIAMGTMEEAIYERSVTKQAIAGRVVDEMQITRHFKTGDLDTLYRCELDDVGERPLPQLPLDSLLADLLKRHQAIYSYQDHNELLQNLPHEELDEDEMKLAWEEYEREKNFDPTMWTDQSGLPGPSNVYPNGPAGPSTQNVRPNAPPPSPMDFIGPHFHAPGIMGTPASGRAGVASRVTPLRAAEARKKKSKLIVIFDSATVAGHRILGEYDDNGKITNDARKEGLTEVQIRVAEDLLRAPQQPAVKTIYIITPTGEVQLTGTKKASNGVARTEQVIHINDSDSDLEFIED